MFILNFHGSSDYHTYGWLMAPAKKACACSGTFPVASFWPKLMIHGGSLLLPTA